MNVSAKELWQQFKDETAILHDEYDVWAFGDSPEMANTLLLYVLEGEKRGTSSTKLSFEFSQELFPKVGNYSVVLDGVGVAQAIICTKVVDSLPYCQISEVHAYYEGEGDRTLAYWRNVHQPYFEKELERYGYSFSEETVIIYELFELVYKRNK